MKKANWFIALVLVIIGIFGGIAVANINGTRTKAETVAKTDEDLVVEVVGKEGVFIERDSYEVDTGRYEYVVDDRYVYLVTVRDGVAQIEHIFDINVR